MQPFDVFTYEIKASEKEKAKARPLMIFAQKTDQRKIIVFPIYKAQEHTKLNGYCSECVLGDYWAAGVSRWASVDIVHAFALSEDQLSTGEYIGHISEYDRIFIIGLYTKYRYNTSA
jgi:hypothetical protein